MKVDNEYKDIYIYIYILYIIYQASIYPVNIYHIYILNDP